MNESELRAHAICGICGLRILHAGVPLFWRVTIERFGVDAQALRRNAGLTEMLGSARLATVMGGDANFAQPIAEPTRVAVCEPCATIQTCIAALAERESIRG